MAKDEITNDMSEWFRLLNDLFSQINGKKITKEQLRLFLEHENPFDSEERKEVVRKVAEFKKAIADGDDSAAEKIASSLGLFLRQTPDKNLTKTEYNDLMAVVERKRGRMRP